MRRRLALIAISLFVGSVANAADPAVVVFPEQLISKPVYPVVTGAGFVLLEVWPTVKDITISAFFLDELDGKSQNLCEAVKKSLDHDAEVRAKEQNTTFTSYRTCMTIKDAVRLGWIHAPEGP